LPQTKDKPWAKKQGKPRLPAFKKKKSLSLKTRGNQNGLKKRFLTP